ncbi:lactate utilization protein [Candidatus Woesebacteria bacterium]|nr:lactate utilization protein [Candidatus Woesebacteria bacterium]
MMQEKVKDFGQLATETQIQNTLEALKKNGVEGIVVNTGSKALKRIKELIPEGASVMNGSSVTLETIGFVDYLKSGSHSWNNLHGAIVKETEREKQKEARRESLTSDYYLGSVHALTEEGEFLVASNTGSQLPHIAFSSPNVILVVGSQKIVPTLEDAMARLKDYVVPLEDKHMRQKYGVGTNLSKILIFRKEVPMNQRTIRMVLVKEKLGF